MYFQKSIVSNATKGTQTCDERIKTVRQAILNKKTEIDSGGLD